MNEFLEWAKKAANDSFLVFISFLVVLWGGLLFVMWLVAIVFGEGLHVLLAIPAAAALFIALAYRNRT